MSGKEQIDQSIEALEDAGRNAEALAYERVESVAEREPLNGAEVFSWQHDEIRINGPVEVTLYPGARTAQLFEAIDDGQGNPVLQEIKKNYRGKTETRVWPVGMGIPNARFPGYGDIPVTVTPVMDDETNSPMLRLIASFPRFNNEMPT